jgi:hypothetical protein
MTGGSTSNAGIEYLIVNLEADRELETIDE